MQVLENFLRAEFVAKKKRWFDVEFKGKKKSVLTIAKHESLHYYDSSDG